MRVAFPDLYFSVEEQIAEGDKVLTRFEWTSTHQACSKGPVRCQAPALALMDNLERVAVRIKYIRRVVSGIVFQARPR